MSVEDEIGAMRAQLGAPNDARLAMMLNVQRSAIAQWKKRGRVPDKARLRAEAMAEELARGDSARVEYVSDPSSGRLLSRALALKYMNDSASVADATANGYMFRALFLDQLYPAAKALMIEATGAHPDGDDEAAYRQLFAAPDLEARFLRALTKLHQE